MESLKSQYEKIYKTYLKKFPWLQIYSDRDPGDKIGNELENREELYTHILKDYSKITKIRNILKEAHKWVFFWLIIAAGIIIMVLLYSVIDRVLKLENSEQFLEAVPIIITVFVSLITVVIGIPTIIAKFLFNTKEDDNITQTVHHTQDHDYNEITLLKERYVSNKKIESNSSTTVTNDSTP